MRSRFFITILITIIAGATKAEADNSEHLLEYDRPAAAWEEMLPLGNGRLGMMTDGDPVEEHIIINEISMWSGCEADYSNPDAANSLKDIRNKLLEGRNVEAQHIMYERFVPRKNTEGGTYGSYQVLGQIVIRHHYSDTSSAETGYRRWLDLREATSYTDYIIGDRSYRKRYFVSRNDDVMIVEISSSEKGAIDFELELDRAGRAEETVTPDGLLKFSGTLDSGTGKPGVSYSAYARVVTTGRDSKVRCVREEGKDPKIDVRQADKAWIIVSAQTSFLGGDEFDEMAAELVRALSEKELRISHKRSVASHKELYERNGISLADGTQPAMPTDKRIFEYSRGAQDNALAALYYHYGRYLLICSTRQGSLPPNLQGLWANTFQTPWNGDYHTNINVQMNHWIAESGNLSELHEPLIDMTLRMVPSGRKSAKDFYGADARGWVQHMMTNVWNYTAPGEHPSWGATNTGGAWLCAHLWEHYLYNGSTEYLRKIYPALKGASEFFLSTMITEPENGYLVTGPTSSPENTFYAPDKNGKMTAVSICMGPTMDNQLIRELFTNTSAAATILNEDTEFADSLTKAVSRIAPHRIGKEGYLMEWLEDYREAEPQHRHVSHLYGLYPGNQISPSTTPELAEACKVTLNRRGDEATGWSRAWKQNFWARLEDGDRAVKLFRSLLSPASYRGSSEMYSSGAGTYPNLLCAHPPFQIDGNFGGAAGISEMLVQSRDGFINILPALPSEWKNGNLHGFRMRGGSTMDMVWKNGCPETILLTGGWNSQVVIRFPEGVDVFIKGKRQSLKDGRYLHITLEEGQKMKIDCRPQSATDCCLR